MGWMIDLSLADRYAPIIEALDISPKLYLPYFPGGVTISPDLVPSKAVVRTSHKCDQEILPLMYSWAVSEQVKDIIEELEPGAQQFFPIDISLKSGAPTLRKYFLMNIRQVIDGVDLANTDVEWQSIQTFGHEHYYPVLDTIPYMGNKKLFFIKQQVEGHHLWRGRSNFSTKIFCSDDLMDAFKRIKVKGIIGHYGEEH